MKKRLTLKTEHLAELTSDELRLAGGAGPDYTGNPICSFSIADPCVSNYCILRTSICNIA